MAATLALCKLWSTRCDERLIRNAIHNCTLSLGHQIPKPLQLDAVSAVLNGKDTFLNVPTGYGKSLVYTILPLCARFILEALGDGFVAPPAVLVVTPLVALMHDQAQKLLGVRNVKVLVLRDEDADKLDHDLAKGWTHIFASPEALLQSVKWRKLLLDPNLVNNLVALVIDEAHCIVKWYDHAL